MTEPLTGFIVGYQVSKTEEMAKEALKTAASLLAKARRAGLETRHWAHEAYQQTLDLIDRSRQSKISASNPDREALEMNCLESQILGSLRFYIGEMTAILNDLSVLNPPLSSQQL